MKFSIIFNNIFNNFRDSRTPLKPLLQSEKENFVTRKREAKIFQIPKP